MSRIFILFFALTLCHSTKIQAQASLFKSSPMTGYVEYRTAKVWVEVYPLVSKLEVLYWKSNEVHKKNKEFFKGVLQRDFNPCTLQLVNLDPGTAYSYQFVAYQGDKAMSSPIVQFNTEKLWMHRIPAPDFSFITGSCSYFFDQQYPELRDTSYGKNFEIFSHIEKEKADFMLWLGDNWYTNEADYYSPYGLRYRASDTRNLPLLQKTLQAFPHLAIWDDHDFGYNDANSSYIFKDESRSVFKDYFPNPSYGQNEKGIYTKYTLYDADFFMLDNRYFRSNDNLKDSVNQQLDPSKVMFGPEQMQWLMNELKNSKAVFKFIAAGSQMLNTRTQWEGFIHFPYEYNLLLKFIKDEKIEGVLFLTGDRHHSSLMQYPMQDGYPLYDMTISSFTSKTYRISQQEADDPNRLLYIPDTRNYARVSVQGAKNERKAVFEFKDYNGMPLKTWTVSEKELRFPSKK